MSYRANTYQAIGTAVTAYVRHNFIRAIYFRRKIDQTQTGCFGTAAIGFQNFEQTFEQIVEIVNDYFVFFIPVTCQHYKRKQ